MGKALVIAAAILAGSFLFVSAITGLWGVYFEKEWWAFFIPFVIGFVLGHSSGHIIAAAILIGSPTPPLTKGGEGDDR